ncbi:MAG: pilus assembly protein N-terminal domain-containing protein [Rhodospirillales bacterium]|nr:pilus assembly protein N-terminal domain-containing protein [Rhodospirillales bacterium]
MRRLLSLIAVTVVIAGAAVAAEPLVVTWDKAHLLRLSKDAAQVIIGNPAYVDATIESPRVLTLFGKQPGETNIIVLDSRNRTILERAVVVHPESGRRVSVISPRKGTTGVAEVKYSCPGGCTPTEMGQAHGTLAPVSEPAPSNGN